MKRQMLLLVALAVVAVLALYWMFLFQPQREELALVEADIEAEENRQVTLQAELNRLRQTRENAPAALAELAAAESIIPLDAALPSALRQMQAAADESGVTLVSISPGRPGQIEGADPGLASLALGVQLQGSYFQVVDFLRRTEDPSITPRAVLWSSIAVAKSEYPELTVSLTGSLFAMLPTAPAEPAESPATADVGTDVDGGAEPEGDAPDVEVDVDVNVETEEAP